MGEVHEGAIGSARNHFDSYQAQCDAEVWRRRGVDRGGSAGVSRMLGRELAGKMQHWLLAHGSMRRGRVVRKLGEREYRSHVKEVSI